MLPLNAAACKQEYDRAYIIFSNKMWIHIRACRVSLCFCVLCLCIRNKNLGSMCVCVCVIQQCCAPPAPVLFPVWIRSPHAVFVRRRMRIFRSLTHSLQHIFINNIIPAFMRSQWIWPYNCRYVRACVYVCVEYIYHLCMFKHTCVCVCVLARARTAHYL